MITSASLNAHCDFEVEIRVIRRGRSSVKRLDALQIRIEVLPQPVRIGDDVRAPDAVPPRFVAQVGFVISLPVLYGLSIASLAAIPDQLNATKRSRPFMARSALIRRHAVARLPLVREAVEDGVVVGELVCVALVFPFAEQ